MDGVKDLVWDGIALGNSRGMGFLLQNCTNVQVKRLRVSGFAGLGGKVIPTPLHVLGRISPIFSPFFPVFCAFSPSRRGGSNEPKTGTQGQESGKGAQTPFCRPS